MLRMLQCPHRSMWVTSIQHASLAPSWQWCTRAWCKHLLKSGVSRSPAIPLWLSGKQVSRFALFTDRVDSWNFWVHVLWLGMLIYMCVIHVDLVASVTECHAKFQVALLICLFSTERKPKPHYVHADSFQVTWWPGDKPEHDINSQQTKGTCAIIVMFYCPAAGLVDLFNLFLII